jgi:hypothetical protein
MVFDGTEGSGLRYIPPGEEEVSETEEEIQLSPKILSALSQLEDEKLREDLAGYARGMLKFEMAKKNNPDMSKEDEDQMKREPLELLATHYKYMNEGPIQDVLAEIFDERRAIENAID